LNAEPIIRQALRNDLPDIVRLLADDALGSGREECMSPQLYSYYTAFKAIE